MNRYFALALLGGASLFAPTGAIFVSNAAAQVSITPAPEPVIGTAPGAKKGAQESHDEVSIEQLMKVVELTRLIAGGISQLFDAAQGQKQALDLIHGAQTGTRNLPTLDSPDAAGRDGGKGLKEMSESVLNGTPEGPPDLVDALNQFRTTFSLDNAFNLKNDQLPSKKMLAQLAAKSVVSASAAESAYKRANGSMERLNDYIAAFKGSADLKTSIDINTRAMIELTQQTNESLRTQSAITSVVSMYLMMLSSEASEKTWVDGLKQFNR